jgi:hypothetical protein
VPPALEETRHPLDRLPPALAARIRIVDVRGSVVPRFGGSVEIAVVALAEAQVVNDG